VNSFDHFDQRRYFPAVSTNEIASEAIALPLPERVSLAQALWESIDMELSGSDELEALRESIRRDRELSSGEVIGRTHEDVMASARQAIGCG